MRNTAAGLSENSENAGESPGGYAEIARSPRFQELLAQKRRFLVPLTIFFFLFYFLLPILTSYTHLLNGQAFGAVSWAWVFGFAQFVMTWTLCGVYMKQASRFDAVVAEIARDPAQNRG